MNYNFELTNRLIDRDIQNGFPGIALGVIVNGGIILREYAGYTCKYHNDGTLLDSFEPITQNTLFDLASNTKIYATTLGFLYLVSRGEVSLNDRVVKFFPRYIHPEITIGQLLSHSAGYAPEVLFFDPDKEPEFYSLEPERTKELIISKIPLEYLPGTQAVYSDTGFMLLGFIIEKMSGLCLDEFLQQVIYQPLGLSNTLFNPLQHGINQKQIAATSLGNGCNGTMDYPQMRTGLIRGEVQDEKAFYSCGGVAGHAGLFSTLDDMLKLTQLILNQGRLGNVQIFSPDILSEFVRPLVVTPSFCCGWRNAASSEWWRIFGQHMNSDCRGHSGFTGTLSVLDFKNNQGVVLLSNKIHSQCFNRMSYEGSNFLLGQYAPLIDAIYQDIGL